jgi:hypothetical protein
MEDQRGDTNDDRFTFVDERRPQFGHTVWKSPTAPENIATRSDETFRSKEMGRIPTCRERYDEFVSVLRVDVVLLQTSSDLDGCRSDNVVLVGVVSGGSAKHFDTHGLFLQSLGGVLEHCIDDIGKESRVSNTPIEQRAGQKPSQLFLHDARGRCVELDI